MTTELYCVGTDLDLVLPRNEVHVWRASLGVSSAMLGWFQRILSADELSRADRFHFQHDRERYIVGHGLLRTILSHYLCADPATLDFVCNEYGKPELASINDDATLRFNMSHSHGRVIYAFTNKREVGIDIEYVRTMDDAAQLIERFCSERERAEYRSVPGNLRQLAFFNCWTRKEAYTKARGEGMSRPLDKFSVSLAPGKPVMLLDTEEGDEETRRWSLEDLRPGAPGYVAAIAVEGAGWVLRDFGGQWAE